jgi:hypothetical protein
MTTSAPTDGRRATSERGGELSRPRRELPWEKVTKE